MDCITTYYRDDKEISFEEFKKIFKEDLEKENETLGLDIAIYTDWSDEGELVLNEYKYKCRTIRLYNSAKELFDEFMLEGCYDMLFDVLKEMSENEIFNIVSKMSCVNVQDGKLTLKDTADW